jgi:hypothetical protein
MRKIALILLALIAFSAVACSGLTIKLGDNADDNNDLRITGSGDLITETRDVSGFDRIEFNTIGKLRITQGDSESLTVEAEENIMPRLVTEVRGGTLYIETERGISLDVQRDITFTLAVKDLSEIQMNGLGDVEMDGLTSGNLGVTVSGAGAVRLWNVEADRLDATLNGLGDIELSGTVETLSVEIPGSGSFKGQDLQARDGKVVIGGLGSASVWVTNELDVRIDGAGSVDYYGRPSVSQDVNGLGSVNQKGNK